MRGLAISALIAFTALTIGCDDNDGIGSCSTPATVRNLAGLDGCGYVFELSDGTYIEPYVVGYCGTPPLPADITSDPLFNFVFEDGKKVLIGYKLIPNAASICMVGPIVKITCITEVTGNS